LYSFPAGSGHAIAVELERRIMIIDGAMGTMIQTHKLEEAEFKGE
jgi:5-methyltetrahydrofolate--homocysteine methyltransferase